MKKNVLKKFAAAALAAATVMSSMSVMAFADEAETEAGEKLIGFIKENSVSPVYLIQTIRTTAMETFDVMVNIVEIMIDSSMYRHAYWILRAMQEEKPQEESIQIMVQELGKYVTE